MKRLRAIALLAAALFAATALPSLADTLPVPGTEVYITYEPRQQRVARRVAEIAGAELPRLCAQLGLDRASAIEIRVVDDVQPYRNALRSELPSWGIAFAMLEAQVIVVDVRRATDSWNSLDDVVPHELSHLLLAQRGRAGYPIWFLEGLAQWQAGEWTPVDSWQLMSAVWSGGFPQLSTISQRYPVGADQARTAYRVSYAAFTTLFDKDFDALPAFLDRVKAEGFDAAMQERTGESTAAFAVSFHEDLQRRYHSGLLIFQTGPLFGIAALLFVAVIARHVLRKRRKLKDLEREERGLSLDDF